MPPYAFSEDVLGCVTAHDQRALQRNDITGRTLQPGGDGDGILPPSRSRTFEAKRREAGVAEAKSKPLNEVLAVLSATCEALGWSCQLVSIDKTDYRHASLSVKRDVATGCLVQQVTGLCEVTVDGSVKISLQGTSFYSYGISQLREALADSLGKIPWLEKPSKKGSGGASDTRHPVQLEPLLRRFHVIARQLRRRHDDRATLTIDDEYDVQDLLHAVLQLLTMLGPRKALRATRADPLEWTSCLRVRRPLSRRKWLA